ncbi:dnaJ homolog subfamily C member 15 isoform X3 [Chelonia mydas]|uniref:dnaJ homolog subfamily C member 15 isoform X3 n=1 Tax=Chelonia mydas TaxID=8469 RepID=UPI001CA95F46|nr:dnaJ homolog subfamily C member 15 isoform X3 [Chelonia mydas]
MEGAGAPSETLRYVEYARVPGGGRQGEPDTDRGLVAMLSRSGNHWNKYSQKQQRRFQPLPSADKAKIRTAHRRIMILNHPDKDSQDFVPNHHKKKITDRWQYKVLSGSPYLATKINEAKDLLESSTKN